MSKKEKEVDEFLEGIDETENDDPLAPSEEDPFLSEKKEEGAKSEEDEEVANAAKPEPFHKDPKVQRYVQKAIAKAIEGIKPTESAQFAKEISQSAGNEDELTDVLTRMIGNDTPEKVAVLKDFKRVLESREAKAAEKATATIRAEQERVIEEDRKAQEALTQGFEDIEEEFNVDLTSNHPVAKKTRNEFIDFVKRIAPKNSQGQVTEFPDFSETFQIFQETKKVETSKTTNRAKELANRGMSRSSGGSTEVAKPKDNSWSAVDKIFSRFTK